MDGLAIVIIIALFFLLLASGLPIAYVIGFVGIVVAFLFAGGLNQLSQVTIIAYSLTTSFVFVALPLYLFMGSIISACGMGDEIFYVAAKWFGRVPGGLATATITACAGFAAVSGSSMATAAAIGTIAIPQMTQRGYYKRLALGSVAAGGTLGILIPPSIPMILYAIITDTSIGKLFMAGVVPGIVLTGMFITYITIICKVRPKMAPREERVTWKDRLISLKKTWTLGVLILFIMGGIYLGIVTPTEAAAVGACIALILGLVVYKQLNWRNFLKAVADSTQTTAMVFLILIGAMVFAYTLAMMQFPQGISHFIASLSVSRWVIIILIQIVLLIFGCFMEVASIILITVPILFPIATNLGFDPIWFGVVITINMELAQITPPLGLNLYVVKNIAEVPLTEVIKGIAPFILIEIFALALVMVFPALSLWLPGRMIY